jgi:hypothetical protein
MNARPKQNDKPKGHDMSSIARRTTMRTTEVFDTRDGRTIAFVPGSVIARILCKLIRFSDFE